MKKPLYAYLANILNAIETCKQRDNTEWVELHTEKIERLIKNHMPSGSGVDNGTKLDWEKSTENKLVFTFGFHHMNEAGFYDGWTEHTAIVTPSLAWGFSLKITGRDRNNIKEYLHNIYHYCLTDEVETLYKKD